MIKLVKIISIAIIVLGCIHLAATPIIMSTLSLTIQEERITFLAMFLIAGIGTILPGIVILNSINDLLDNRKVAYNSLFICTLYFFILAGIAVLTMYTNPFAYVTLLLAIILLIPLEKMRKYKWTK